jgi:uncharacterized protein (TIGR00369 family)
MENHSNPRLELFKSQIGRKLDKTPSLAGNWLEGTLLDIDSHHIRVAYTVRSEMCNPGKILHGGVASLMLDDVIGMGNFVAGSEHLMTSINLNVDFLSAAQIDEKLEVTTKTRPIRLKFESLGSRHQKRIRKNSRQGQLQHDQDTY